MNFLSIFVISLIALTQATKQKLFRTEQCEGTICPQGCCPEVGWYCCPDGSYCASNADNCPYRVEQLVKTAAKKQCEGTVCPGGCCPEVDWHCCADGIYCASNADNCPFATDYMKNIMTPYRSMKNI